MVSRTVSIRRERLYIGGDYVSGSSGRTFDTSNPATGEIIAAVDIADADDVESAVAFARAAQRTWAGYSAVERGRVLRAAADLLRARNDELARLEVLDTGKPIREAATIDIQTGADALEYFGGIATTISGEHIVLPDAFAYTRREPLGVVAGIGAWNYPLQIACWKAGPALAAGNAMVFKPSEQTPLTALKLAEIFTEAGAPPGLFNVIQGDSAVGALLTDHTGIAKISLTGGAATGPKIMRAAASTLKLLTLELGGKSPLIIFKDADLDDAVDAALMANFLTQGEVCVSGTRVFVAKSLHAEFTARLVEATAKLRVGDPMDPKTQIGSLISQAHRDRVLAYVASGLEEGATLIMGGRIPKAEALRNGAFLEPTIFDRCSDEMTIVNEEIFGPVMSILTFTDEDEVVARANATLFGLSAGLFTRDLARAHRVAAALEVGMCWINTYHTAPVELPFGGYKRSGLGRENGKIALEQYTQLKSVYVELGKMPRYL